MVYTLTITNTGNVVDTFDLLASGNSWTTTLPAQVVTLTAGSSQAVTITVSIPPGAADQETDTVTITATSQGDSSKTDSATLTSICILGPVYGVALSADDALSGPAGGQVIYNLTITNTGSMTDSFDLTTTGQTWMTTLSTSQVSLAPFASMAFSVTVSIPPGATDQETDAVTITATSQGDSGKNDTAVLTTTIVPTVPIARIFLPIVVLNLPK